MNKTIKESGTATGLRITFAIIMVITVGIFTNCIILQSTVLNEKFWEKTVKAESIEDAIKDELTEQVRQYVITNSPQVPGADGNYKLEDVYNLETGDEFTDELIDYVLDEMLDAFLKGDTELDEDRFDEIFEEHGDEFLKRMKENGVSQQEFLEAKSKLFSELNETMSEVDTSMEETHFSDVININKNKVKNITTMIITGVLNVIMIVVLIILHKNKFRPVRAVGIAVTVTEVVSLIGWSIIWSIFKVTNSTVGDQGGEIVEMILKAAIKSIGKVMGILGVASVIGIVLIVGGCIGVGVLNSSYRKKNQATGNTVPVPNANQPRPAVAPAAAAPVAQATPVQQAAPVAPAPVAPAAPVAAAPVAQATAAQAPQVQQPAPAAQPAGWTCPSCGKSGVLGNFCDNCGTPKPQ